jgi:L-lactate utilization protein LutB
MSFATDNPLDAALSRMNAALETLERAVDREIARTQARAALEDEVSMLMADRNRLAEDLDRATCQAERLASTNRDVAYRLDQAMETIHAVLMNRAS